MAYATAADVASFCGVAEASVQDVQLAVVTALIDRWRGDMYAPLPDPEKPEDLPEFVETHSGNGTQQFLYLRHTQVYEITTIAEDGIELDEDDYVLVDSNRVQRLNPALAGGDVNILPVWAYGVGNITVEGTLTPYDELLKAATCMLWQYLYSRNKAGGMISMYPSRMQDFTDGGGNITRLDTLEDAMRRSLEIILPLTAGWGQ